MSASLGKGLVIARVNSCPGKEPDNAPGYTTVDFRKGQIAQRIGCSPVSRHPRREIWRHHTHLCVISSGDTIPNSEKLKLSIVSPELRMQKPIPIVCSYTIGGREYLNFANTWTW